MYVQVYQLSTRKGIIFVLFTLVTIAIDYLKMGKIHLLSKIRTSHELCKLHNIYALVIYFIAVIHNLCGISLFLGVYPIIIATTYLYCTVYGCYGNFCNTSSLRILIKNYAIDTKPSPLYGVRDKVLIRKGLFC